MTAKKRRLGRGLEALLSSVGEAQAPVARQPETEADEPRIIPMNSNGTGAGAAMSATDRDSDSSSSAAPMNPFEQPAPHHSSAPQSSTPDPDRILRLRVDEVDDNPFQPRRDFSEPEIVSLAESLKDHDMLQPVLVRPIGDRYQLISGERRLRAAIRAGWTTIPAKVREADDRLVAELAIVENLQRKDLNAIEKALSFRRYLDEHSATQEELAKRLKVDRSTIANLVRLLELPDLVQQAVRSNVISYGHARTLLPLGEEHLQIEFCNRIQAEGWSVRETERQVQARIQREDGDEAAKPTKKQEEARTQSRQIASLEQEFKMALGTKVEIKKSSRGKGKITIQFNNVEEFERLRELLCDSTLTGRNRMAS